MVDVNVVQVLQVSQAQDVEVTVEIPHLQFVRGPGFWRCTRCAVVDMPGGVQLSGSPANCGGPHVFVVS